MEAIRPEAESMVLTLWQPKKSARAHSTVVLKTPVYTMKVTIVSVLSDTQCCRSEYSIPVLCTNILYMQKHDIIFISLLVYDISSAFTVYAL